MKISGVVGMVFLLGNLAYADIKPDSCTLIRVAQDDVAQHALGLRKCDAVQCGTEAIDLKSSLERLRSLARAGSCGASIYETSDAFAVTYSPNHSKIREDIFNLNQGVPVSWVRSTLKSSEITNF